MDTEKKLIVEIKFADGSVSYLAEMNCDFYGDYEEVIAIDEEFKDDEDHISGDSILFSEVFDTAKLWDMEDKEDIFEILSRVISDNPTITFIEVPADRKPTITWSEKDEEDALKEDRSLNPMKQALLRRKFKKDLLKDEKRIAKALAKVKRA